MKIEETLQLIHDLPPEAAVRLMDEMRSSHPDLFSTAEKSMLHPTSTIGSTPAEIKQAALVAEEGTRFDQAVALAVRQQQFIEQQQSRLDRLVPLVRQLMSLSEEVLPFVKRLMQAIETDAKRRRRLKAGSCEIMKRVHELRKAGYKWDSVHRKMKAFPGYRISSAEYLRQRFRLVTKSPDWSAE